MLQAIEYIKKEFPFWDHNHGADHIMMAMYDFGACMVARRREIESHPVPDEMRLVHMLSPLGDRGMRGYGNPGHCFRKSRDVVVPTFVKLDDFPRRQAKDLFAVFRGVLTGSNPFVRAEILRLRSADSVFSDTPVGRSTYLGELQRSMFCFTPPGTALWSFRLLESIAAGCIPVLFDDGDEVLPFEDLIDWESIVVRVPPRKVSKSLEILKAISLPEMRTRLKAVSAVQPYLLYQDDAFHLILYELFRIDCESTTLSKACRLPQKLATRLSKQIQQRKIEWAKDLRKSTAQQQKILKRISANRRATILPTHLPLKLHATAVPSNWPSVKPSKSSTARPMTPAPVTKVSNPPALFRKIQAEMKSFSKVIRKLRAKTKTRMAQHKQAKRTTNLPTLSTKASFHGVIRAADTHVQKATARPETEAEMAAKALEAEARKSASPRPAAHTVTDIPSAMPTIPSASPTSKTRQGANTTTSVTAPSSAAPSAVPSGVPKSALPTFVPTLPPTQFPTVRTTPGPSAWPTLRPTEHPSVIPTTGHPSTIPTVLGAPTWFPTPEEDY
jgi:hypothetical protein